MIEPNFDLANWLSDQLWHYLGWLIIGAVTVVIGALFVYYATGANKAIGAAVVLAGGLTWYSWYFQGLLFFRILGAVEVAVGLGILVTAAWVGLWWSRWGLLIAAIGLASEFGGNAPWHWAPRLDQWIWLALPVLGGAIAGCLIGGAMRRADHRADEAAQRQASANVRRRETDEAIRRAEQQHLQAQEQERASESLKRQEEEALKREAEEDETRARELRAADERAARDKEKAAAAAAASRQAEVERLRMESLETQENEAFLHAISARVSFAEVVARERRILEELYVLGRGIFPVRLLELKGDTLGPGEVLAALRALKTKEVVTLTNAEPRIQWTDIEVRITKRGRDAIEMSDSKGQTFNAPVYAGILNNEGPVSAAAIGQHNLVEQATVKFTAGVQELASRVREATPSLSGETAKEFDQHLRELEAATTAEKRRSVLAKVAVLARSLGQVAAPILTTANKVLELLGPHRTTT